MVTLDEVVRVVASFAQKRGATTVEIGPDTALLREGIVDSFSLVELGALLATELRVELPPGALIPEDYESPRVMCDRLREVLG